MGQSYPDLALPRNCAWRDPLCARGALYLELLATIAHALFELSLLLKTQGDPNFRCYLCLLSGVHGFGIGMTFGDVLQEACEFIRGHGWIDFPI